MQKQYANFTINWDKKLIYTYYLVSVLQLWSYERTKFSLVQNEKNRSYIMLSVLERNEDLMEKLTPIHEEELLKKVGDGKYVLFFDADWCPDCQFIKPAMPEIEKDFPEYTFLEVNRDEQIDLAAELNIFGIPSFIVYDHGKEIGRFVDKNRKTKQQVEDFLRNLK